MQRELDNEKKANHELAERCEELQLQVRWKVLVFCSYILMYLPYYALECFVHTYLPNSLICTYNCGFACLFSAYVCTYVHRFNLSMQRVTSPRSLFAPKGI